MLLTSSINSPMAAGRKTRRYRFVFADHRSRGVSNRRRQQVADHVAGWMGGQIIREERCGTECIVVVEVAQPVLVANAERFATACPHYVADTFSVIG